MSTVPFNSNVNLGVTQDNDENFYDYIGSKSACMEILDLMSEKQPSFSIDEPQPNKTNDFKTGSEHSVLMSEIAALRTENSAMKAEISDLKTKNAKLESEKKQLISSIEGSKIASIYNNLLMNVKQ